MTASAVVSASQMRGTAPSPNSAGPSSVGSPPSGSGRGCRRALRSQCPNTGVAMYVNAKKASSISSASSAPRVGKGVESDRDEGDARQRGERPDHRDDGQVASHGWTPSRHGGPCDRTNVPSESGTMSRPGRSSSRVVAGPASRPPGHGLADAPERGSRGAGIRSTRSRGNDELVKPRIVCALSAVLC